MPEPAAANFAVLDEIGNAVATFTGIRQQFIDNGWKPEHAELMVIEVLRSSTNAAK